MTSLHTILYNFIDDVSNKHVLKTSTCWFHITESFLFTYFRMEKFSLNKNSKSIDFRTVFDGSFLVKISHWAESSFFQITYRILFDRWTYLIIFTFVPVICNPEEYFSKEGEKKGKTLAEYDVEPVIRSGLHLWLFNFCTVIRQ